MEGVIASNACSGPFPLLDGRRLDGSFARREARGTRSFRAVRDGGRDRFQCLLRPVPAAGWAAVEWVLRSQGIVVTQNRVNCDLAGVGFRGRVFRPTWKTS